VQDDVLLAYQIAFDLVENELQSFIIKVSSQAGSRSENGCLVACRRAGSL
jgi:hypothetical protein